MSTVWRWLLLLVVSVAILSAQHSDLTTTADGNVLLFSSTLRPKGATPLNSARLLRYEAGIVTPLSPEPAGSSVYRNPQISGDGRVVAYTNYNLCFGGSSCLFIPTTYFTHHLVNGFEQPVLTGAGYVSPNGRYLYHHGIWGGFFGPTTLVQERIDLQTGEKRSLPATPAQVGRQIVTNDGRVLGAQINSALALVSPEQSIVLPNAYPAAGAIVNATGEWVIYSVFTFEGDTALRSIHVPSGLDIELDADAGRNPFSITDDGSRLLFVDDGQAFTIAPDGTQRKQIAGIPEDVTGAVIAGAGRKAWLSTALGRLLRVDLETGAVEEMSGRSPQVHFMSAIVPGSLGVATGSGFATEPAAAEGTLPEELAGVRVTVADQPARVARVTPTQIAFLVPPVVAPGEVKVEVRFSGASPLFEIPHPFARAEVARPTFFQWGGLYEPPDGVAASEAIVQSEDFTELISANRPARPGEILHFWAIGFGAVDRAVDWGEPAPDDPPARVSAEVRCFIGNPFINIPVDVLFAGLAPGQSGMYQLDVRLPADLPEGSPAIFTCASGDLSQSGGVRLSIAR